jgi:hypothetical protein
MQFWKNKRIVDQHLIPVEEIWQPSDFTQFESDTLRKLKNTRNIQGLIMIFGSIGR